MAARSQGWGPGGQSLWGLELLLLPTEQLNSSAISSSLGLLRNHLRKERAVTLQGWGDGKEQPSGGFSCHGVFCSDNRAEEQG